MGRAPFPHLIALVCGLLAAVALGCGSDRSNLIPQQRAADLTSQLDDIKSDIDAGRCDGLNAKVRTFHDDATSLTKPVDARLRRRINEGVRSLQAHAVATCVKAAAAKTQTQTTDTTTTETQPPPTTTAETTTTPPADTTTTTTPTDTTTTTQPSSATPPTDTGAGAGDGGGGGNGGTPGAEVVP